MNKLLITAALVAATIATGAMKASAGDCVDGYWQDGTPYCKDRSQHFAAPKANFTPKANASTLKDYSDRSVQTCDKDDIKAGLDNLWADGMAKLMGMSVIYVKGEPVETSRKRDELRCRVSLVTTKGSVTGVFKWVNQDGHALYGFDPGVSK